MKAILLLFILASILFADVGPAPKAPDITVKFLKDGKILDGNGTLFYNCTLASIDYVAGKSDIEFSCSGGTCRNDQGWFYKFDPCYYPSSGYFRYNISGREGSGRTENLNFTQAAEYEVDISIDDGSVIKKTTNANCPVALIVLAAPLLLYAWKPAN